MPSGKYRVSVNGFRCSAETWDDAGNWDGKHDEVLISTSSKYVDKNGQVIYKVEKTSPVMGDTNGFVGRVKAGSASNQGGIVSGDSFPFANPWIQSASFPDPRDVPPFIAWEGDLEKNENVVFITLTIWEWDPGQSMWTGWLQWQVNADAQFGQKAKLIVAGKWPMAGSVFDAVSLGIQTVGTLQSSGVLGNSGIRPIGMQKDAGGNTFSFNPQVLVLTFDVAENIVASQPSGLGPGVLALRYLDDPYLRGDYVLYLQVDRVGVVHPDVALDKDGQTYREANAPEVYVLFGGAKFWVPDPGTLNRLYGGWPPVQVVAANALQNVPTIPRNGTLLREENRPEVWLIENGKRRHITTPALLGPFGGWPAVKIVPDNAVSGFPIGIPVVDTISIVV